MRRGRGGEGREGAHHEGKKVQGGESGGGGGGGGGEKISDVVEMPQLPIWFFRHLFIVMGHFVLPSAGSAAPPNNGAYYRLRLPLFDSPEHAQSLQTLIPTQVVWFCGGPARETGTEVRGRRLQSVSGVDAQRL